MVSSTLTENENGGCCRLHRDAQLSACQRFENPGTERHLVGVGAPPGADLFRKIAPFLSNARDGHPGYGKRRPDNEHLQELRTTAQRSRDAVYAGDFATLGAVMQENTAAQRHLHLDLVSSDAEKVIEIARSFDALGWKVNGAGGEGGSLTLLCGSRSEVKRAMIRAIEAENPLYKHIPTYLSRYGLRVWKSPLSPNF